jgi:hypothetical protein
MSPFDIDQAIAEACGWTNTKTGGAYGVPPDSKDKLLIMVPCYHRDLEAMRQVEETLTDEQWDTYDDYLYGLTPGAWNRHKSVIHADAATKAQAFLRVIGKWKEGA